MLFGGKGQDIYNTKAPVEGEFNNELQRQVSIYQFVTRYRLMAVDHNLEIEGKSYSKRLIRNQ